MAVLDHDRFTVFLLSRGDVFVEQYLLFERELKYFVILEDRIVMSECM